MSISIGTPEPQSVPLSSHSHVYDNEDDAAEAEILVLSRNSQSQVSLLAPPEYLARVEELQKNLPDVRLTYEGEAPRSSGERVFFFDIDNCLYRRSTKIHDLMQIYIHRYFKQHLQLSDEEADKLHMHYYKQYGLALEGLVREHRVDALEYNKVVDDALPLEKILVPNPDLRDMLLRMKASKKVDKLWLFTNAYRNHGLRVIHLLGLGDVFDGLTYCDYNSFPLTCKPMEKSFSRALKQAGDIRPENAYFVDDSEINVKAAQHLQWKQVIHYVEMDSDLPQDGELYPSLGIHLIRDILDIEKVCPDLF